MEHIIQNSGRTFTFKDDMFMVAGREFPYSKILSIGYTTNANIKRLLLITLENGESVELTALGSQKVLTEIYEHISNFIIENGDSLNSDYLLRKQLAAQFETQRHTKAIRADVKIIKIIAIIMIALIALGFLAGVISYGTSLYRYSDWYTDYSYDYDYDDYDTYE